MASALQIGATATQLATETQGVAFQQRSNSVLGMNSLNVFPCTHKSPIN